MRLHAFLSVQLGHPQVQPEDLVGRTIMKIKKSVENIIFICHIEVASLSLISLVQCPFLLHQELIKPAIISLG